MKSPFVIPSRTVARPQRSPFRGSARPSFTRPSGDLALRPIYAHGLPDGGALFVRAVGVDRPWLSLAPSTPGGDVGAGGSWERFDGGWRSPNVDPAWIGERFDLMVVHPGDGRIDDRSVTWRNLSTADVFGRDDVHINAGDLRATTPFLTPITVALEGLPPDSRVMLQQGDAWVDVTLPGAWNTAQTVWTLAPRWYAGRFVLRFDYSPGHSAAPRQWSADGASGPVFVNAAPTPAPAPPPPPASRTPPTRTVARPVAPPIRTNLTPAAVGRVNIAGIPNNARVWVDGSDFSTLPGASWTTDAAAYGVPVSLGTHSVEVRAPSGERRASAVAVTADAPTITLPYASMPITQAASSAHPLAVVDSDAAPAATYGRVVLHNVPQVPAASDAPWRDVRIVYPDGTTAPLRPSATNGRFESDEVPSGACVLEVRLCTMRAGAATSCATTTRYPLTIAPGSVNELNFFTSPTVDGDAAGPQTGIDADLTGHPDLTGATLAARRVSEPDGHTGAIAPTGEWMPLVATTAPSRLALYALVPGRYEVRSQRDGATSYGTITVREDHVAHIDLAHLTARNPSWEASSSASGVTATYNEWASMAVRPLGADGRPTAVWQGLPRTPTDGTHRVALNLPAGRYELSVTSWRSNPSPISQNTVRYGTFTLGAGETVDLDRVVASAQVPSWWSGTASMHLDGAPANVQLAIRPRAEPEGERVVLDGADARGLAAGAWTLTATVPGAPPTTFAGDIDLRAGATASVAWSALHSTATVRDPTPTEGDTAMVVRVCDTLALAGYPTRQRVCDGDRVLGPDGRTYVITLQPDGSLAPVVESSATGTSGGGMSTGAKAFTAVAIVLLGGAAWWWMKLPRDNPGCGCGPSCGCEPCRRQYRERPTARPAARRTRGRR